MRATKRGSVWNYLVLDLLRKPICTGRRRHLLGNFGSPFQQAL
jgi:hypothetical protein